MACPECIRGWSRGSADGGGDGLGALSRGRGGTEGGGEWCQPFRTVRRRGEGDKRVQGEPAPLAADRLRRSHALRSREKKHNPSLARVTGKLLTLTIHAELRF